MLDHRKLKAIISDLKKVPDTSVNMLLWADPDLPRSNDFSCGWKACAMGWHVCFRREELWKAGYFRPLWYGGYEGDIPAHARPNFEFKEVARYLTNKAEYSLVTGEEHSAVWKLFGPEAPAGRKAVIKAIQEYIAQGTEAASLESQNPTE